mmetsp:Transcript_121127/g.353959  ORF Transcript_121127/g.353959 Transcript_121127/m.353959 type:complete len:227 (+) Transcript_121127:665-1345(+)
MDSCRSVSPTARGDNASWSGTATPGDGSVLVGDSIASLFTECGFEASAAVAAAAAAADAAAAASSSAAQVGLGAGAAGTLLGKDPLPAPMRSGAASWAAPPQATAEASAPRAAKAAREATTARRAAGTADSVNSTQETWRPQLAATAWKTFSSASREPSSRRTSAGRPKKAAAGGEAISAATRSVVRARFAPPLQQAVKMARNGATSAPAAAMVSLSRQFPPSSFP